MWRVSGGCYQTAIWGEACLYQEDVENSEFCLLCIKCLCVYYDGMGFCCLLLSSVNMYRFGSWHLDAGGWCATWRTESLLQVALFPLYICPLHFLLNNNNNNNRCFLHKMCLKVRLLLCVCVSVALENWFSPEVNQLLLYGCVSITPELVLSDQSI